MSKPPANDSENRSDDNPFKPPQKVDKYRPKPYQVTLVDILIAIVVISALLANVLYKMFGGK